MGTKVHSPHADFMLGFLFFLEAIFFLPTDPMLIFYCLEQPKKAFRYATIATVSSVAGGTAGYLIGYYLWHFAGHHIINHPWVNYIMKPDTFHYICHQYKLYEYWAIFIAGFTPVPYKAATLTAGFCRLSLIPFILVSFLARGARFYLYAISISIWGKQMKQYIDRYITRLVLLALVIVIVGFYFIKK